MSAGTAPKQDTWPTAITDIKPNAVRVRGHDIADLMGNVSFGSAVYLILRGELPSAAIGRLMDAIIVSSIDHGATPPSVLAARTVASTGASLSQSVAAGIMSINKHHGGAIENCARQLGAIIERAGGDASPLDAAKFDDAVKDELAAMKTRGERFSGFGHRIHTNDPRTARLFELAEQAGVTGNHVAAARAVERAFADAGKPLPINVDGAIGAILADMGFAPEVMNGLFMIARVPGLVAHVTEEQTRMKPMRRVVAGAHEYDGPAARSLPHSLPSGR
ncbi:MAG: citryl-CoA lyase [Phycisphaeraceae bacterium]|nr:citryl-CoA lyase [Phycisphaerales bacterium]MCB9861386.1 citryl-CoA lyase [Phycisphaeraceae bacterium]